MINRFFSVRCAILGYPKRGLSPDAKYLISLELIKITNDSTKSTLNSFLQKHKKSLTKKLNNKPQSERAKIIKKADAQFLSKFHNKFKDCLVKETLTKDGLRLTDGIYTRISESIDT